MDVGGTPRVRFTLRVLSIPTLILFKGGAEVERIVGAVPRPVIEKTIAPYV